MLDFLDHMCDNGEVTASGFRVNTRGLFTQSYIVRKVRLFRIRLAVTASWRPWTGAFCLRSV